MTDTLIVVKFLLSASIMSDLNLRSVSAALICKSMSCDVVGLDLYVKPFRGLSNSSRLYALLILFFAGLLIYYSSVF